MGGNVEAWYRKMEQLGEADMPVLVISGQMLTPRDVIKHARAKDETWQIIQRMYPNLDPKEVPEFLLIERLKRKYKEGKLLPVYLMQYPYILTPEQQIKEIESGSAIGKKLLEAEKKLLDELMK